MKASAIYIFLFLLSFSAFAQVKPSNKSGLIGREYQTISEFSQFNGYKENVGAMLEPTEAGFGVGQLENKLHHIILLFERVLVPGTTPKRKLLDTLNIGNIGRSKLIILASCSLNKKSISDIIALVNDNHVRHYKSVLKAWRADRKSGRFEPIATKNIRCDDPGYADED